MLRSRGGDARCSSWRCTGRSRAPNSLGVAPYVSGTCDAVVAVLLASSCSLIRLRSRCLSTDRETRVQSPCQLPDVFASSFPFVWGNVLFASRSLFLFLFASVLWLSSPSSKGGVMCFGPISVCPRTRSETLSTLVEIPPGSLRWQFGITGSMDSVSGFVTGSVLRVLRRSCSTLRSGPGV